MGKLRAVLDGSEYANGANDTCKSALLTSSQDLLAKYPNVTNVSDEEIPDLITQIGIAVGTRDIWIVMVELGHVISQRAAVGRTTLGHVGTNVNLYCEGLPTFERMCKGIHEITYVSEIMALYLWLLHQQELETLKHRNISALENPIAFID
ncbi:alkaline phosphatase, putative [Plasmopara halstedii]|uniref:Alkaline phosphatase, putative n=1 Tax=Plasmopara halstedii TaxID=4781 RepID=A0A0N7L491_PLAHL|nr:alkaline phosphatase, putative [Plasmopara halstedii]CEG38019.1 alkaline phosphatase, putative [Plasmopara halstedii]|eukprot:XP_024574388.1 alkaline phosphatase, putative [Plasmopara halstedii]